FALKLGRRQGEERSRVAGRELAFAQEIQNVRRKLEQADEIHDGAAVFAGSLTDVLGAQVQLGEHRRQCLRGFDGIEILALDVLDERNFHQAIVGNIADDDRDHSDARELRGAPTPLAGDKLIPLADFSDYQRLDDAVGTDRLREFLEAFFLEYAPRLEGIGV